MQTNINADVICALRYYWRLSEDGEKDGGN